MFAFITRSPARASVFIASAIGMICLVNVLLFTWSAAIPLPASDAWYFISAFLPKALDGTMALQDLFMQRGGGVDHAQPMQKLIFLGHLYLADLDFRFEAIVGVFTALTFCFLLAKDVVTAGESDPLRASLGVAAILLLGLSLNSTNIYTWPLVTLGWVLLLVVLVFFRTLDGSCTSPLRGFLKAISVTLLAGLVVDELIFPAAIAVVLARALYEPKLLASKAWWIPIAGIIAGLMCARAMVSYLSPAGDSSGASLRELVDALGGLSGLWAVLNGVLGDGLVHRTHRSSGDFASVAASMLIVVMALCHVAYWWRVLVSRRLPARGVSVVSIALMLLFYAMVAGILMSRVPAMGAEYFHQPRYVLFYQIGVIAWLLLFLTPGERAERWTTVRQWSVPAVFFGLLMALQVWLSWQAWTSVPYLKAYVVNADRVILDLAETNVFPEAGCPDILTICNDSSDDRAKSLALLRDHRLSVFSPSFRERHGFETLGEWRARSLSLASYVCADAVTGWGPRLITLGKPFNLQADGSSTYWISLLPDVTLASIRTSDGAAVSFVQGPGVASFSQTPDLARRSALAAQLELRLRCGNGTETTLSIPVENAERRPPTD